MATRPYRTLLVAFLVVLQFLLQPLGSVAWCAVVGGQDGACCCGQDGGATGPRSCCDDRPDAPEGHAGDCGCQATPELPPFEPTEAPQLTTQGVVFVGYVSAMPFEASDGSQRGLRWPRPRAPGEARPLRLLTGVFRI